MPTLVLDRHHHVTHWNKAITNLTGIPMGEIIGTDQYWAAFYQQSRPILADLILDEASQDEMAVYYGEPLRVSSITEGAYEAEAFFPEMGSNGRWLYFTAAPLKDMEGKVIDGFEWVNISGDKVDHPVPWKQDLNALAEKSVRIEFQLQDAQLYGFSLHE